MLVSLAEAQMWHIEVVDSSLGDWSRFTSLALDSLDNPHISYYEGTYGDLKYARWNGSSWDIEIVDLGAGLYPSLALDSSGNPHISYSDWLNYDLKYARWNGSSWEIETIDAVGEVGEWTSLALENSVDTPIGTPHISYEDFTNLSLKYARWNGSSWDIETVDSEGAVGRYTSLALDSSSYPHISYYDNANDDLKYACWNGSSWDIETVDSANDVGQFASLALDSSDNPHISYLDWSDDELKYTHWNGSSWDIETVDTAGVAGWYTSLALDSLGNPHISYCEYHPIYDLKYAKWNGSSWDIETVDSAGFEGLHTSLTLDSSGNPHISYFGATGHDLKYSWFDPNTGISDIETATINEPSDVLVLHAPLPNPTEGSVTVTFELPESLPVTLSVYDLSGRLVENLVMDSLPSGEHILTWNPGPSLSDGCYLIVLDACGERAVRRCVKL